MSNPFLRSPAQQFTSPASKTTLNELAGSNKPLGMMAPPAQPQQPPLGGASFGGLPAPLIPPPAAPQPAVSLYPNVAATTSFGQPPYGAMYGAGAFSSGYAAPMQQPFPQQLQPFPYQPRQAFWLFAQYFPFDRITHFHTVHDSTVNVLSCCSIGELLSGVKSSECITPSSFGWFDYVSLIIQYR